MDDGSLALDRPMKQAERDLRVKLAAAYRLVDYFGWTELIDGPLTACVPGPGDLELVGALLQDGESLAHEARVEYADDADLVALIEAARHLGQNLPEDTRSRHGVR